MTPVDMMTYFNWVADWFSEDFIPLLFGADGIFANPILSCVALSAIIFPILIGLVRVLNAWSG